MAECASTFIASKDRPNTISKVEEDYRDGSHKTYGRGDSDNRHIALRFKRDQLAFFALMLFTQIRNPHSSVIMPNTDDTVFWGDFSLMG